MELLLGCRLVASEKMKVIKLSDMESKEKVASLRSKTAEQLNVSSDAFDLLYCGSHLEDGLTLDSCGLKNGSIVHVLSKRKTKTNTNNTNLKNSDTNAEMLASVFKSFVGNPLLELAMRRLTKRPEVIENIISSSPGLSRDAVAIAILQDPDLIVHFTDAETIKRITKLHPALLEAAQHIASAVHDEAHNFAVSSSLNSSQNTTGHSYSLNNLSEDEEMGDSSQSSDSAQASGSQSRNQSLISAAQLFNAIRAQRAGATGNATSTPASTTSNSPGVITFEMFNQAMQQAFATNDSSNAAPAAATTASIPLPTESQNSPADNLQTQISTMHEMGLRNDAINLQALQITNGDVQAAIELVLNGFGES